MIEKELLENKINILQLKIKDLEFDLKELEQKNIYLQEIVNNYYKTLERQR